MLTMRAHYAQFISAKKVEVKEIFWKMDDPSKKLILQCS